MEGFATAEAAALLLERSPVYLSFPAVVGGVACRVAEVVGALGCLLASPGLMVRQPLARAGSPLARCDYHAAAAPFKVQAAQRLARAGRGAAGRHITKVAFCTALELVVTQAERTDPIAAFAGVTQRAWLSFSRDFRYAEEMAKTAVALLQRGGKIVGLPVRDSDSFTAREPQLQLEVVAV